MTKVFICYRRDDSADITGRFYDRLVSRFGKETIFKDVDSIPLGVDFRTHIDKTIRECAVVFVMIGERWLDARGESGTRRLEEELDHVRIEIQSALSREIPIIPLLVGRAHHPKSGELPESIRPLAYRNSAALRSDPHFHSDASYVIEHVTELLEPAKKEAPKADPPPVPPPSPEPVREAEKRHPESATDSTVPWIWLGGWILAGALAGMIAEASFLAIFNRLMTPENSRSWYPSGVPCLITGLILGLSQWFVLRWKFKGLVLWIPVTMIAVFAGDVVGSKLAWTFQPPETSAISVSPPATLVLVQTPPVEAAPVEAPAAAPVSSEPSPEVKQSNALRSALAYAICLGCLLGFSQSLLFQKASIPVKNWVPAILAGQILLALFCRPLAMDWEPDSYSRGMPVQMMRGLLQGAIAAALTAIPLAMAFRRRA